MTENKSTVPDEEGASGVDLVELERAIKMLSKIVKPSTATDEFPHFDLTLVGGKDREECQRALILVKKAIKEQDLSEDDFKRRVGI